VSYFGIFEFRKSNKIPGQTVLPGIPAPLEALKPPGEPRPGPLLQRFVDNRDGTITELKTNLMWIKNGWRLDFVSAVTWPEALKKCNAFRLGGYGNWRLSGVEEWRSLIDTGNQAPALVEPNPFENIIVHMPYWTRTEFAGGSEVPLTPGISVRAYTVMLYSGNIIHQKKTDRAFILPVRSIP